GLSAAIEAGRLCKNVVILDDKPMLGGQLVKQTHRFFGDARHYAGVRGIRIASELTRTIDELKSVKPLTNTRVFGLYDGNMIGAVRDFDLVKITARKIIIATGAYERTLVFENNDLPGVYGSGGVQTLMNTYGVIPGSVGLVVGSGNVGLILAYQLLQSGVNVKAILEALPRIGGYFVHAAKVRRYGVEILTRHSVLKAVGGKKVEGAVIARLDEKWNPMPGTERTIDCDFICIAVGLNPTYELIQQAGCEMKFMPDLGGFVPTRTRHMGVADNVYVAGDLAGIEEATTAMLEGQIAGLHASLALGYGGKEQQATIDRLLAELDTERAGPFGERIRRGLGQVVKLEAT
ncbi:MAG: NAD(P)/FAD-dependent oxidoreductase, partial [Candidatus Bathyarchaeia archaeon]